MTSSLPALAVTVDPYRFPHAGWIGDWSPGIGDPSLSGWLTVLAYIATGFYCLHVRRRIGAIKNPTPLHVRERKFWRAFGLVLLALGVNKQLDLQTAMTEFLRQLAKEQGWYGLRYGLQVAFILAMALALPWIGWKLWKLAHDLSPTVRRAGLGLSMIGIFVLIRAASFHHVDRLLGVGLKHLRLNGVLELGGIFLVFWYGRKRRKTLISRQTLAERSVGQRLGSKG